MAFDVKALLDKVGGNDLVKGLSEKVGVGAEVAAPTVEVVTKHVSVSGSGISTNGVIVSMLTTTEEEAVQPLLGSSAVTVQVPPVVAVTFAVVAPVLQVNVAPGVTDVAVNVCDVVVHVIGAGVATKIFGKTPIKPTL